MMRLDEVKCLRKAGSTDPKPEKYRIHNINGEVPAIIFPYLFLEILNHFGQLLFYNYKKT